MPVAEILIEGEIGMDVTLSSVRAQFAAVPDATDIFVRINSIGGDVDEGFAIYDFLTSHGLPVTTIGEGRVYSIATIILLAGDNRLMTRNSQFMIHNPWAMASGDADEFRRYARELERREVQIADFYARKTGKDKDEIRRYMKEETFFSAEDAVQFGFADAIHEVVKVAAMQPLKAVAKFSFHHTDMSEQITVDSGVFNNILSAIGKILNSTAENVEPMKDIENVVDTVADQEAEDVPNYEAQIASMNERLTALEANNAELETEKANLATELEGAKESIAQKEGQLEAVLAKVKELESLPMAKVTAPEATNEKENAQPSPYDGLAAMFNRK